MVVVVGMVMGESGMEFSENGLPKKKFWGSVKYRGQPKNSNLQVALSYRRGALVALALLCFEKSVPRDRPQFLSRV